MKNTLNPLRPAAISRRQFTRRCALGTAALASGSILGFGLTKAKAAPPAAPATLLFPLDQDWLFGGKFNAAALASPSADAAFSKINLPHCVVKLSWQNWDPAAWQSVWIYRRRISLPKESAGRRLFLKFDGVMTGAKPAFNGVALPEHLGGYLPFQYELTQWLKEGDNLLEVAVDSRWQSVPPDGKAKGPSSVDYLEPGGIFRSVSLCALPHVFISDVFAKPVNVLDSSRRVDVSCTLNAAAVSTKPLQIKVALMDGPRVVSSAETSTVLENDGDTALTLSLSNLGNIELVGRGLPASLRRRHHPLHGRPARA